MTDTQSCIIGGGLALGSVAVLATFGDRQARGFLIGRVDSLTAEVAYLKKKIPVQELPAVYAAVMLGLFLLGFFLRPYLMPGPTGSFALDIRPIGDPHTPDGLQVFCVENQKNIVVQGMVKFKK